MECTWISVVGLTVLIFTSYMENMKCTAHPSSATSPTKEISPHFFVTTIDPIVKMCQSNFNDTEIDKNNVSEISNCTHLEFETLETSATERNLSSAISIGKQIVTYRDFLEYTRYRTLLRTSPYISNIPGFITNALIIRIVSNIQPWHTSEIYMFVLGCADLATVIVRFTYTVTEQYYKTKTGLFCKMFGYFLTISQIYSNLILVSWTIEHFIAVMFPINLGSWCSIRNTKITAIILLLFCMLTSIPYITDFSAANIWNGRTTVNVCVFSVFMLVVWIHVESVYYIYLPIILVFICNLTILCRLSSMTKDRIGMASNQDTIDKKAKENRKMTILLLTISGIFLLLHIPYAIILVVNYMYPYTMSLLFEDPHAFARYLLYTTCGFLITEFQNSVNFFLYCISGTKFRTAFRKTFC